MFLIGVPLDKKVVLVWSEVWKHHIQSSHHRTEHCYVSKLVTHKEIEKEKLQEALVPAIWSAYSSLEMSTSRYGEKEKKEKTESSQKPDSNQRPKDTCWTQPITVLRSTNWAMLSCWSYARPWCSLSEYEAMKLSREASLGKKSYQTSQSFESIISKALITFQTITSVLAAHIKKKLEEALILLIMSWGVSLGTNGAHANITSLLKTIKWQETSCDIKMRSRHGRSTFDPTESVHTKNKTMYIYDTRLSPTFTYKFRIIQQASKLSSKYIQSKLKIARQHCLINQHSGVLWWSD